MNENTEEMWNNCVVKSYIPCASQLKLTKQFKSDFWIRGYGNQDYKIIVLKESYAQNRSNSVHEVKSEIQI